MMSKKDRGYYGKYWVNRVDQQDLEGRKHHNCRLFVLDLTHDKHAIPAIKAYVESCKNEYPLLASDLLQIINKEQGDG